ncbi:MAG: hypothetical protein NT027_19980 [Proteobacteria bacterium]|nr:hypothetical protein [Pseudomonadota bacterium]
MRRIIVTGAFVVGSNVGMGHEMGQRLGSYQGSDGESRVAGGLTGAIEAGAYGDSGVTSASYTIDASLESIRYKDISKNDYMLEFFPSGLKEQQSVSIGTSHTISKINDLRAGGTYSTDSISDSKSWNLGLGRWWFQDSFQTNIDVSQTITSRPSDSILDTDFQLIELGPKVSSRGASLSFKHLATTTTVWGGSYTRVISSDRPRLDAYAVNVRQFIPSVKGAIHAMAARLINTGAVSTDTTLGSLAGVQAEIAILKEIVAGTNTRVGYRYVREDEQSRAYGDHLIYGADNYSWGVTQDIKKNEFLPRPTVAHFSATRSIANSGIGSTTGEAGLSTKF